MCVVNLSGQQRASVCRGRLLQQHGCALVAQIGVRSFRPKLRVPVQQETRMALSPEPAARGALAAGAAPPPNPDFTCLAPLRNPFTLPPPPFQLKSSKLRATMPVHERLISRPPTGSIGAHAHMRVSSTRVLCVRLCSAANTFCPGLKLQPALAQAAASELQRCFLMSIIIICHSLTLLQFARFLST